MKNEALSGGALGLLMGLLIGLSVSEVIGSVLGALTGLLTVFFGLQEEGGLLKVRHGAMTSFALVCALSVLLGIYLRTHETLTPSISDMIGSLHEAGVPTEDALSIALLRLYGVRLDQNGAVAEPEGMADVLAAVLKADDSGNAFFCRTDPNTLNDLRIQYSSVSGGEKFLATQEAQFNEADSIALVQRLIFLRDSVCKSLSQ